MANQTPRTALITSDYGFRLPINHFWKQFLSLNIVLKLQNINQYIPGITLSTNKYINCPNVKNVGVDQMI